MTTACTFNEADHPRYPHGQFAKKVNDAPAAELTAETPGVEAVDEATDGAADEPEVDETTAAVAGRIRQGARTAVPARRGHLSREAAAILRDAKATADGAVTDLHDSFQSVFD